MKQPQATMTPEEEARWLADMQRGYAECDIEGCNGKAYNYATP